MTARTLTWTLWLAAPALVLVRTFWCQLHGSAEGAGPVSFDVAVPWALKAALGWILAAALLVRFGGAVLESPFAARRPRAMRTLLGLALVGITFGAETWLLAGETRLSLWTYERLPLHLTFVVLMLVVYLLMRARSVDAVAPAGAPVDQAPTQPVAPVEAPEPHTVEVMTGTGRTQLRIDDIECLEADRNYVTVHTPQRSYLLRQTLASLEKSLRPESFLRVHRSMIVNRAMIRERRSGGVLVLRSGRTVRVSRGFTHRLN